MKPQDVDVIQAMVQQEREWLLKHPQPPKPLPEPPTIHWTELAEAAPGGRIATEWNFYRKQVGRLLAEGHEGKWILIKGEEIIDMWETQQEAERVRAQRFPVQDVLIHQILEREPILRGGGYHRVWRS